MSATRQKRWRRLTGSRLDEPSDDWVEIVRVKKTRTYSRGSSPLWRRIARWSAVVSLLLALFWLWLLLGVLFGEPEFWPSWMETLPLHWAGGSSSAGKVAAVPEPSRTAMAFVALCMVLFCRRR